MTITIQDDPCKNTRLIESIKKTITREAGKLFFQHNDELSQTMFREGLSKRLHGYKFSNQSYGKISDYTVICDGSNNTLDVVSECRFVAHIKVKPYDSKDWVFLHLNIKP